jgi:hypothetical protein
MARLSIFLFASGIISISFITQHRIPAVQNVAIWRACRQIAVNFSDMSALVQAGIEEENRVRDRGSYANGRQAFQPFDTALWAYSGLTDFSNSVQVLGASSKFKGLRRFKV